jgi:hypothetical protein
LLRVKISLPELAYRYVLSQPLPQTALWRVEFRRTRQAIDFTAAGPLPDSLIDEIRSAEMPEAFYLNPGN